MENEETKLKEPKKGLRDAIKALGLRIVDVFRDYPVAMIGIMTAALLFSILVEISDHDLEFNMERVAAFFLITAVQALFFEEVFKKNWLVRGIGYGASAIISILYVWILSSKAETIFGMKPEIVTEFTAKVLALQGTIMVGYAIWHMFRRLEDDFEVYATKAAVELIKATVVYALFAAGLATIILIFNALIFNTDDFLAQVEIFLASGIYVPMCLKAISGKNEEPGKFFRVCIHYVLLPMLLIAFGIIYLYIAKIFITNDVPNNKIFFILSCLFTVGMPIWTSVHGLQQKKDFLSKAAAFLPYVFLPFLILQCWAMGVRISDYGITTDRYWAIILIICELVYFVLYFLHHRGNKQAISWMLFVLMAMVFLTLLCPGTNYADTVIRSQLPRITKVLDKGTPTEKEKSSIRSSYREIKYLGQKGKEALNKKLSSAQKEQLDTYEDFSSLSKSTMYLHSYMDDGYVEVAGYSRIYRVSSDTTSGSKAYEGDGKVRLKYSNYGTRPTNGDPLIADLSELFDYAGTFSPNSTNDFSLDGRQKYSVDDTHDLWITNINIQLYEDTKEIDYVSLSGYLLEK